MTSIPLEAIEQQLPEEGLFRDKAWLLSPEPLQLECETVAAIDQLGARISQFLGAANAMYFDGSGPDWVTRTLDAGKPESIIELGASPAFRDAIPRVIRPDVLLTADGLKITEIDSLPGGIGLTGWLNQLYDSHGWPVIGGGRGMIDSFDERLGGGNVVISREAQDYRPEMDWIVGQMNGTGTRVIDTWEFEPGVDESARAYRYFELWDFDNVERVDHFIALARSGEVDFTPPMKAFLEEKLWLALLWSPGLRDEWRRRLGEDAFDRLREFVPQGWVLDPEPIPHFAEYPGLGVQDWRELKSFSQKERRLVVKISGFSELAWGSRGIHIGHDLPGTEWGEAIENALENFETQPHIMQRFHEARVIEHPYYDRDSGEIRTMRGRARLCPYYFVGDDGETKLRGILATICPEDKKIIHGMTDAILVPCVSRS